MPEQPEPAQQVAGAAITRRQAIVAGSAVAAGAWIAPQIVSVPAASAATAPPLDLFVVGDNIGQAFASSDGGATWAPGMTITPSFPLVTMAASATRVVAFDAGGVAYHSADGSSWSPAASSPSSFVPSAVAGDGSGTFVVVGNAGMTYRSVDDGQTWLPGPVPGPDDLRAVAYGTRFVAVGNGGHVYVSNDDGATWSPAGEPPIGAADLIAVACFGDTAAAADDSGQVFFAPPPSSGDTWISADVQPIQPAYIRAIIWTGAQFVGVGDDGDVTGKVFLGTNGGAEWNDAALAPDYPLTDVATDGTTIVATDVTGHVWVSTDDGNTWTQPAGQPVLASTLNCITHR